MGTSGATRPLLGPRVGCAGWSIPKEHADRFPEKGSHLARYARRFPAVEINSSFYRPHRPSTYARRAAETPDDFMFAVKVPKEITLLHRLVDVADPFDRFLDETASLGPKRGPLLVQLPPSLVFKADVAAGFFGGLRAKFAGDVACEPRHREARRRGGRRDDLVHLRQHRPRGRDGRRAGGAGTARVARKIVGAGSDTNPKRERGIIIRSLARQFFHQAT